MGSPLASYYLLAKALLHLKKLSCSKEYLDLRDSSQSQLKNVQCMHFALDIEILLPNPRPVDLVKKPHPQ